MRITQSFSALLLAALVSLLATNRATAQPYVSLPFYDNFGGDTVGASDPSFTTSSSGGSGEVGNYWVVVSPGITNDNIPYGNDDSANGFQMGILQNESTTYSAAEVQISPSVIAPPTAFAISSDFQIKQFSTAHESYIGLLALGNHANDGTVASGYGSFVWGEVQVSQTGIHNGPGSVGFVDFENGSGGSTGITQNSQVGSNLPMNTNDEYNITVVGTYDYNTNLDVLVTASDVSQHLTNSKTEVILYAQASAYFLSTPTLPANGTYFGYMDRQDTDGNGNANPPYQTNIVVQNNFNLYLTNNPSGLGDPVPISNAANPSNQFVGNADSIIASFSGAIPMYFEWQYAGTNTPGSANSFTNTITGLSTNQTVLTNALNFASLSLTNAGYYRCLAQNVDGTSNTAWVYLNVLPVPAQPMIDVQTVDAHNGGYFYQGSGVIGTPADDWNYVDVSATAATNSNIPLFNSTGASTAVTLSYTPGTASYIQSSAIIPLLSQYLESTTNTVVTLSGLQPSSSYNVVVYSCGGPYQGGVVTGAATGTSTGGPSLVSDVGGFTNGVNYVQNQSAISDASGNLTFSVAPLPSTSYSAWDGLQIMLKANASFSGLTANSSVTYGTGSVTLSGKVSASGPLYPTNGETVGVTINGNQQNTTINDSMGDFTINYNLSGIPASGTPYAITYSYGGDSLLTSATNNSTTLSINKATPLPTLTLGNPSATYNGSAQTATVTVTGGTPGTVGTIYYNGSSTAPTTTGSYTITVDFTPVDNTDYNSLLGTPVSGNPFVIQPATPTVTPVWAGATSFTYSGAAQGPTLTSVATSPQSTGTTNVTYLGVGLTTYASNANAPTNAGSYLVTVTIGPDANNNSASTSENFSINPATPTVTPVWTGATSFTYNGAAQGPTLASVATSPQSTGTTNVTYLGVGLTTYASNANAPTNAGSYSVTVTIGSDANNNSASASENFSINPLSVVLTGTRAYDGTSNAVASILSVANAIGSDNVDVASGTASLSAASAGTQDITSLGTLALGNNTAGDYTLTGASGTVLITAQPGVVYDDTENQLDYILSFTNGQEIGDQIYLQDNQTYPYLTNFSLEYYSTNAAFYGAVTADVRFYLNDGPPTNGYNTPSNIFYDTGWFVVKTPQTYYPGTNSVVLDFLPADLVGGVVPLDPSMAMPSNFTVSVTFQGLAGSALLGYDTVGLDDFDPPAVGTNYGDYWFNNEGTWELLTNTAPVAFSMEFIDSSEPGAPLLYVSSGPTQATVWWSPYISGWTLQTNNVLNNSGWGNYQGTINNNSATISSPQGDVFFRLYQP